MKPKGKILSLLLVICLVAGLLPTTAFALDGDKAIMLGTSGISGFDTAKGGTGYDYIYFGSWTAQDTYTTSGPIKWRVLDEQTNTGADGLFLLSDGLLGTGTNGGVDFGSSNVWQNSTAQEWCEAFYSDNLTTQEQGAVLETTKRDSAYTSTSGYEHGVSSLSGDRVFFLSAEEAENSAYGFANDNARIANYGNSPARWWLRSPYAYSMHDASAVYDNGRVGSPDVGDAQAARPAFNLDLNSVLFTSAAVGGKIPAAGSGGNQGAVGADTIFEIGDYAGNEWKLTLLDSSRNFAISNAKIEESKIDFSYSNAQTGTNEYISVVIEDNGAITHYGRILQLDGTTGSASGTASFTLPAGVTLGNDTKLYVFNEQYNGGEKDDTKLTDYGSKLIDVQSAVDTTAPTLTAGTATRISETTATVKFTSDEAGTCYYIAQDTEITLTKEQIAAQGTKQACKAGENEIELDSITANTQYVAVVVQDAAGNISDVLKFEIPAYIAPVYAISADTQLLDFGTVTEGYTQAPAAKKVTITNTGNQTVTVDLPTSTNYIITAGEGFTNDTATLAPNGTASFTAQPKTGLGAGDYSETLTISGSNSTSASVKLSFEVLDTYTLTVNLNGGSGTTTGGEYTEGTAVPIDAGSRSNYRFNGWTSSNGGTFADASSAQTTFTMPAADTTITAAWSYNGGGGSSTPTKTPSQQAIDKIKAAKDGDTVEITLKPGQTKLDKEVFETLSGRDVTLVLHLDDGVDWTIYGQDIAADAVLTDLDMGVSMNTSTIPVDLINAITGEIGAVQMTLAHDGEFGFALTLTAPLGKEYADLWANLYHYDENAGKMVYQTAAQVDEDGNVALPFDHASQYAIVIDTKSHELPFTDLADGAWYLDAVAYVYRHDLMDGVGNNLFAPNATLNRAMAVTILYRLEGSPAVTTDAGFNDVADGQWYTDAVNWAAANDIVNGVENNNFNPTGSLTREQMATVLYRYAQYKGADVSASGDLSGFADSANVSSWAVDAVKWAVGSGLVNGVEGNALAPQGTSTRAQAATILMRLSAHLA